MMFHVGQKVVCVDDSPSRLGSQSNLKIGAIYTVAGNAETDKRGVPGIFLVELLSSSQRMASGRYGFRTSRFRPLITHKTDISIFTAMLGPRERVTT